MDDAAGVCVLQRVAQLPAQREDLLPGEPAVAVAQGLAGEAAAAFEDDVERLALDVLHDEEGRLLVVAGADQADDVRVLELLEDAGFAFEPLDGRFIAEQDVRDHLQGDALARPAVDRAEDGAHRPAAQFPLDVERADLFADQHFSPQTSALAALQVYATPQAAVTSAISRRRARGRSESYPRRPV